jgi:hypothetical protein
VAPSRSNTEVFPPVAAVAANWRGGFDAADPDNRQHQRGNDIRNRNRDHRSVHEQGGTSTTSGDASTATSDTSTSGTQTNGNTTATASDGQSNAGGTAGPIRPIPPNSQTSSGSGTGQPFSTRTGKNALNETVADCMKIWEPATHMSKADWQRTCRRVQGRLDQVTREVLEK